jgi:hypothetical protein
MSRVVAVIVSPPRPARPAPVRTATGLRSPILLSHWQYRQRSMGPLPDLRWWRAGNDRPYRTPRPGDPRICRRGWEDDE